MEEKDVIAEETGLTTKQVRPQRKEKLIFNSQPRLGRLLFLESKKEGKASLLPGD
jgi:hypothetical protein